jgi:hypothetical protein
LSELMQIEILLIGELPCIFHTLFLLLAMPKLFQILI